MYQFMTLQYEVHDLKSFLDRYGPKEEVVVEIGQIDDEVIETVEEKVEDTKARAVKMAFIGAGQGGGNLADAFWANGYRRVIVVNTTTRDMQRLSIPESNRYVLKSEGGAGKNPAIGKKLVETEIEEIYKLMQSAFKKDVDQILICVGAGGGTGSGASMPLIKAAKHYMESIGAKDVDKKVGVIVTLPTKDESAAVQRNALDTLMPLLDLAEGGKLSPLVLVDNARVMSLYGKASVVDVWGKANKNIAGLFDVFNVVTATDDASAHLVCDPKDYKTVLEGGILTFGRTKIEKVEKATDVADAVRANIAKGLLVEGLDISKAHRGAAILVAPAEGLASVSQEAMENAFASLNRMMSQDAGTTLHRGVYEGGSGIYIYGIFSGLGRPLQRISEMESKAGKAYPN